MASVAALVLLEATDAHAHGMAEAIIAMGLLVVVVGAAVLVAFTILYVVLWPLRVAGLIASPAGWAAAVLAICLAGIVVAPVRVLPFSVRYQAAGMDRLFPNMKRKGFRSDEVPRLIEMLGGGADADRAVAILCAFGDHVPELSVALQSSNPRMRGNAVAALGCIGPPAAAVIPQVIRLLQHETDWMAQTFALGFIERAAGWDGSRRWIGDVLPVLDDYLEYPGSIPGNAAVTLEAIGGDAAPAVPTLRRVLLRRTGATNDDRFVEEHVTSAIHAICAERPSTAGCD